ncbi:MAG: PAS domain S-box protein, partial [Candidatus Kariarchaeaceae archaeon]
MSSNKSYEQILQELNSLQNKYEETETELKQERILNASLKEKLHILNQDNLMKIEAETQLSESEKRYRSIVEKSNVGIIVRDISQVKVHLDRLKQQGVVDLQKHLDENPLLLNEILKKSTVTDVNDEAIRIEGAENKEDLFRLSNIQLNQPVTSDNKDGLIRIFNNVEYAERTIQFTNYKNEEKYIIIKTITPQDTDILITQLFDITDLELMNKRLRTMEERYRTLFESSPIGIVVIRDTTILYANSSFSTMYGYSHENEIIGLPIGRLQAEELVNMLEKRGIHRQSGEEEPTSYDSVGKRKNGSKFPIHVEVTLINLPDGPAILSFIRDITEQKKAELDLKESEEKFRMFFEDSMDATSFTTFDGRFEEVNQATLDMVGYTRDEIQSINVVELYADPKERERLSEEIQVDGEIKEFPFKIKCKDDKIIDAISSTKARYDQDGNILGFMSIIRDITEQKKAEEALKEEKERYRKVTESTFEGIVVSIDGKMVEANESFAKMYGYNNVGEMKGLSPRDLCPPESADLVLEKIRSNYELPYEWTGVKKDGTKFFVESVARNIHYHGQPARVTAMRDITERRKAEQLLQESEKKYRELIETSHNLICQINLQGEFIYINPAVEKILGYKPEELIDTNYRDLKPPDTIDDTNMVMNDLLQGKSIQNSETRYLSKDGQVKTLVFNNMLMKNSRNEITGIQGIATDLTEWKAMQTQNQAMLDAIPDIMYRLDINGTFLSFIGISGMENTDPERHVGKNVKDVYPDLAELTLTNLAKTIQTREIQSYQFDLMVDGRRRFFDCRMVCYGNTQDEVFVIVREITKQRLAAEELRKSEEKYRLLFENTPIAFSEMDISEIKSYIESLNLSTDLESYLNENEEEILVLYDMHKVMMYNSAYSELYEIDPTNLYRRKAEDSLVNFSSWKKIIVAWYQGENLIKIEGQIKTYSGLVKDTIKVYSVLPDDENSRTHILLGQIDITDRKASEIAMKESEEQFRSLFEQSHNAIIITSPINLPIKMNQAG